jgi:hypothetical protein
MSNAAEAAETLPCGHAVADSLFEYKDGTKRLIASASVTDQWGQVVVPAAAWCAEHIQWVPLTAEQYERLAEVPNVS